MRCVRRWNTIAVMAWCCLRELLRQPLICAVSRGRIQPTTTSFSSSISLQYSYLVQVELIERVRTALVMIVSQSVPGVFGIAPCTCVAKRVDETSAKTERGGKRQRSHFLSFLRELSSTAWPAHGSPHRRHTAPLVRGQEARRLYPRPWHQAVPRRLRAGPRTMLRRAPLGRRGTTAP